MIEGWTCSRCSTSNAELSLVCSTCGTTRPDDGPAAAVAPVPEPPPAAAGAAGEPSTDGERVDAAVPWAPPTTSDGVAGWIGPDGMPVGEPAKPRPLWRRIPVGFLLVALIVAGAAVAGWYFGAGRSSSGEITRSGDLMAGDLRVGDCFDLKDPSADEVEDVTAVPCTVEHEYETVFVGSLPEGDYPPEEVFETYVEDNCAPAFDAYVGRPLPESELDIFWLFPTDDAWRSGDRSVQCAAYHPRVHRLTESLKGSGQ
jgi:hypothetical protein